MDAVFVGRKVFSFTKVTYLKIKEEKGWKSGKALKNSKWWEKKKRFLLKGED